MKQQYLFSIPEHDKKSPCQTKLLFLLPNKNRSVRGELLFTIFQQQKMLTMLRQKKNWQNITAKKSKAMIKKQQFPLFAIIHLPSK